MINVGNQNELNYEQINQKIKNSIKLKFKTFNEPENSKNYIPLSKNEIRTEINKELNPILYSLKNEIHLNINDVENELKSFKLRNYKIRDINSNIFELNKITNYLKNREATLNYEHILAKNLLDNISREKAKRNINLISKKNKFLNTYEENDKIISSIVENQNEIKKYLENYNEKKLSNIKLLNDLKNKFFSFTEEFRNISFSNNKEAFNKFEKSINFIKNKIKDIQNDINQSKNIIKKKKKKEEDIPEIFKMKNNIKINKAIISNEINNKIEQIDSNNQKLEENIIKNINKINDINENMLPSYEERTKGKENQINNIILIYTKKADIEEKNNEFISIKNEIENLNNKEKKNELDLEKINLQIAKTKSLFKDHINNIEYSDYLNNLNTKIINISNNYNEKTDKIEKEEKNSNNFILEYIQSRKDKENNLQNELNKIIEEISNIQILLDDNKEKVFVDQQNILQFEKKFYNIYENIEKIKKMNDIINKEKNELKDLEIKILEIEKKIRNEPIENFEYRNSILKNINNCIFENNKNMNQIIKKGLINKEKKNNLLLYLNDIEKKILNNKKYFDDLIDNFTDKQNKINNRNQNDIKLINKNGQFDAKNGQILEKLYNIEDEIDKISGKYSEVIDNAIEGNKKRFENKQNELIEYEKNINKELDDLKIFIDEKINGYKSENSNGSNFNFD